MGTSGFSYQDWVGPVYPESLQKWQWLGYYAERFDTVELNVSYYRLPTTKMAAGWVERTPEDFLFTLKAHQSITHDRKAPDFDAFLESLAPISEAGKLACVLAQFPYSFHPTQENRDYLLRLKEGFGLLPVVIEFRDQAWVNDDTFNMLEELQFGYCCVDEPRIKGLMPPITKVTSDTAYVRFHGRNAEKWWQHEHAYERYDYTYSEEELNGWVPRIRELDAAAPLTLVYANNHYRGQSVDTLNKLGSLLAEGA
jgi:uncharacterized protein YecE (DUF72 family)